jgi:F-type H+-transporting ATPase subunit gamma
MSDTLVSLRRKINGAGDLQSVVRTMKAVAASSIGQYENSIHALAQYSRSVELGLGVCFRNGGLSEVIAEPNGRKHAQTIGAVVFGSDQGLVGQFNDAIVDFAVKTLTAFPNEPRVWAIGERVNARLIDAGLKVVRQFPVPSSVKAITPLVGDILMECEALYDRGEIAELHLFLNSPKSAAVYTQVDQRLLPLDKTWMLEIANRPWPTKKTAEVIGGAIETLQTLISEYLFISLFRVCAESLASENTSRLTAMQRAEKNISESLKDLNGAFNRLRKDGIDEELFDVITGFEMINIEET